jgi:putative ABC transport system ATP-binding protein
VAIGRKIAETTIEMFDGVPPGDPLFERYSFISADAMDACKRTLAGLAPGAELSQLDADGQAMLVGLALSYIEPRHRFRLLNPDLRQRIVDTRSRIRTELGRSRAGAIEFYDPERLVLSSSIRDNLLFGRLAFDLPDAEQKVSQLMREVLNAHGLEEVIYRIGLESDVGPAGKQLDQRQRTAVDIARCLIKRPEILIVDSALSAYDRSEARTVLAALREFMRGRTLVVSIPDGFNPDGFDKVFAFDGPRVRVETAASRKELV